MVDEQRCDEILTLAHRAARLRGRTSPAAWETDEVTDDEGVVILEGGEARLLLHVVDTFERLLRYGHLSDHQRDLLTADGSGPADASADLLMAGVVAEASELLRRQLQ